jgi:lysyl-tRNA synthetase class 2
MFNAMRSFFNDRGYLEVETPVYSRFLVVLQHAHLSHSLDMPLYMRIANELYLKD